MREGQQSSAASARQELEDESAARTLNQALAEKTLLLHEVEHRVKNNLQTISTLIAMQARVFDERDPKASFRLLQERVDALGAVHRPLNGGGMVGAFDLAELIEDLAPEILKAYSRSNIELKLDLQRIPLTNSFATPLGLIVNELITNAARHAWRDGQAGRLQVSTEQRARQAVLTISDDGVGMDGVECHDPAAGKALSGLRLAQALVRQIRGTFMQAPAPKGTIIEIGIPLHD